MQQALSYHVFESLKLIQAGNEIMCRKKLKKAFDQYTADFDMTDIKIYLKYVHTMRVAEICERIAVSLGLRREDMDLAWELGMLHDVGRFQQIRVYQTFNDGISVDHAEYGADILFRDGMIEKFDPDPEQYDLIEKAIRCHNKYRLPEGLTEREVMFCQILRDADKVDIFRVNAETGMENIYNVTREELENSPISRAVYENFLEKHAIPRNLHRTVADHWVGHVALTWELVYPESRKIAKEQGYLNQILEFSSKNPETALIIGDVKNRILEYLQ